VRVAPKTPHLEIAVSGIQRIAQSRRGLRRTLEGEHPFIPGVAGEAIGFLAGRRSALLCCPNGRTTMLIAEFCAQSGQCGRGVQVQVAQLSELAARVCYALLNFPQLFQLP
jgi:hypothetical protein